MLVDAFKNIKITLQIKAIFRVLNNPPSSLLTSPKAAKSAIFVRIFPARLTTINIIKKVTPKAVRFIISGLHCRVLDNRFAAK